MTEEKCERNGLGELVSVDNQGADGTESTKLLVGWLRIDGDLKRVAFTESDLKRPLSRAERNLEDLPVLEAKPLGEEGVQALKDEIERLNKRGFWSRVFNR